VDLLAGQGIDQCNTEPGAESALSDIDTLMQQVCELRLDDAEQFHQECAQLLDPSVVVCRHCYFVTSCLSVCLSVTPVAICSCYAVCIVSFSLGSVSTLFML